MKSTKNNYDFYSYSEWLTSWLYGIYLNYSKFINFRYCLNALSLIIPFLSLDLYLIFTLLDDLSNNIYLSRDDLKNQNYFDACEAIIPSFVRSIGYNYIVSLFFEMGNDFYIFVIVASFLYVAFNTVKLIKTEPKFNTRFFLKAIPILIMILALICYFNPFDMMASVYYFDEIQVFSSFAFVMLAGMYDYEDNKILSGTFNISNWQKYVLGFAIKMCLIFLVFDYDIVLVAHLVPFWSYVGYVLLMVPLVFNQTLAEEYIFRSFVYKTKDCFDQYKIIFSLLCLVAVCIFVLCHVYQFQNTSAPILFTFAAHFLNALAWMVMTVISGGVEYSSGYHFGNNLMISLMLPFLSLVASHDITLNISFFAYRAIISGIAAFMIFIPVVLLERNFSLKTELKIDPTGSTELKYIALEGNEKNQGLNINGKPGLELVK